MNILIDSAMPNSQEVFGKLFNVILKPGRQIVADDLIDIDALMVRSVTKVNEQLLQKANKLKFVGSATAGIDHIDCDYLKERSIHFACAPGSNKVSVGDYILSVILNIAHKYNIKLKGKSIGIIGCGNTGKEVEQRARALNMRPVLCDPPLYDQGMLKYDANIDKIFRYCTFISLHVPLIKDGKYKTEHLVDHRLLSRLKARQFLINASRGSVVDNKAMLELILKGRPINAWFDVYEGEPDISNKALLPYLIGHTAHIAGYSLQSKKIATVMLFDAMVKSLELDIKKEYIDSLYSKALMCNQDDIIIKGKFKPTASNILEIVSKVYDAQVDSLIFKNSYTDALSFDYMRKNYKERNEIRSVGLKVDDPIIAQLFKNLGFIIK